MHSKATKKHETVKYHMNTSGSHRRRQHESNIYLLEENPKVIRTLNNRENFPTKNFWTHRPTLFLHANNEICEHVWDCKNYCDIRFYWLARCKLRVTLIVSRRVCVQLCICLINNNADNTR